MGGTAPPPYWPWVEPKTPPDVVYPLPKTQHLQRGHKLADHFYLRSDGTRAYYFSLEDLRRIFVEEVGERPYWVPWVLVFVCVGEGGGHVNLLPAPPHSINLRTYQIHATAAFTPPPVTQNKQFNTQTLQTQAGFLEVEAGYIRRVYANRGQGATRRRTWVHARFEKPAAGATAVDG